MYRRILLCSAFAIIGSAATAALAPAGPRTLATEEMQSIFAGAYNDRCCDPTFECSQPFFACHDHQDDVSCNNWPSYVPQDTQWKLHCLRDKPGNTCYVGPETNICVTRHACTWDEEDGCLVAGNGPVTFIYAPSYCYSLFTTPACPP